MSKQFPCYVGAHRKRWALSQRELAQLLGVKGTHHISRLEACASSPGQRLLIALDVLFGTHPKDMVPKLFDEVEESVIRSLYQLEEQLAGDTSPRADRKRQLIKEAFNRAVLRAKTQGA